VFERRLGVLLGILVAGVLLIVIRLVDLQMVHGREYRQRTAQTLLMRPKPLPFVRGSILDRDGSVLVCDEPCWDIRVDYSVLALGSSQMEPRHLKRHVRRWRRRGRYTDSGAATREQVERAFLAELDRMWLDLANFESRIRPATEQDLRARGLEIDNRISAIRRIVKDSRGFDADVAEERTSHAVVSGLDQRLQVEAREAFERYPWVHVEPSSRRSYADGAEALAHVLGRLGRVDASDIASDPNSQDPFVKYVGSELRGKTGVELAAERMLRGRRGQMIVDREGRIVEGGLIESQDGRDVTLTVSGKLQRLLYELLDREIPRIADSSGGAIVVVDVPTREVLALVSYPSYEPARFNETYTALRDDTERLPLRFRAVMNRYAPGSTVKPLACLAGLESGRITTETRINCSGYLFEDVRDRWRCWQIAGTDTRKAHGPVNVVEALRGSCNVFMYSLGEQVGVAKLCEYFQHFGVGQLTGIGLREEARGINPWPYYLTEELGRSVTPGTARLFAIGQGEVALTPVQAANVFATYANGKRRPLVLIRGGKPTREWIITDNSDHWSAIRQGMYEVVNHPDGTAYEHARLIDDRYVLCGKTGSATAAPWPTSYRVAFENAEDDAGEVVLPAGNRSEAIARFLREFPGATFDPARVEKASTWPRTPLPDGEKYSHAWFGGFLQAVDENHEPAWSVEPRVAFAVLIEFGGSGGRTSGPVGREVAETILDVFGPDLEY